VGVCPPHIETQRSESLGVYLFAGAFCFLASALVDALFFIATTLASTALLAACRNWTQARSFQAVFNKNDPRRRALNHKRQAPKEDVMFKTLPVAVFVTVMNL
jgi:positive regulator of sigma E activity